MSLDCTTVGDDYLYSNGSKLAGLTVPFAIGAWVYVPAPAPTSGLSYFLSVGDANADIYAALRIQFSTSNFQFRYYVNGATTTATVVEASGYTRSAGKWYYVLGITAATNDHRLWVNGGVLTGPAYYPSTSTTDTGSLAGLDMACVGALYANSGSRLSIAQACLVAEAAVWNTQWDGPSLEWGAPRILSHAVGGVDDDVKGGVSPLLFRPDDLLAYWPLNDVTGYDWMTGKTDLANAVSSGGLATDPRHPPITYPPMDVGATQVSVAPSGGDVLIASPRVPLGVTFGYRGAAA